MLPAALLSKSIPSTPDASIAGLRTHW